MTLPPMARRGGPEVLAGHADRTLLLCYPDEDEAEEGGGMAAQCLRHYAGGMVVHVGELLGAGASRPSPWGRTTDPDFQVVLGFVAVSLQK